ncbi:MAG TPA: low affinity iron permease family protein [Eoetvoesiella sp.]
MHIFDVRQAGKQPGSGDPQASATLHLRIRDKFRTGAERISSAAGTPQAFSIALFVVLLWMASGPLFGFSDTWQLIINTGTTIVTFLMVFLIQNAQNRDAVAVQLKLDELLRSMRGARTGMINIDQLSDEDLERLRKQFQALGDKSGGCSELEADINTEEDLKVRVHTKFDSKGDLESREVNRAEKRQRTIKVTGEDDDQAM